MDIEILTSRVDRFSISHSHQLHRINYRSKPKSLRFVFLSLTIDINFITNFISVLQPELDYWIIVITKNL